MNMSYIQTVFDESIKTVSVVFDLEDNVMSRHYTYKTRLDLKPGDVCAVEANGNLALVEVVEVHEEPRIGPEDRVDYKWISAKVDVEAIQKGKDEDQAFADKARNHMRKKAREQAKAALGEEFGDLFALPSGDSEKDEEADLM